MKGVVPAEAPEVRLSVAPGHTGLLLPAEGDEGAVLTSTETVAVTDPHELEMVTV